MKTAQIEQWVGEFGQAYTDRNVLAPEALDALYVENYGVSRTEMNARFLAGIPRQACILEVGCNIGNQLLMLKHMGFEKLFGIEIQTYAIEHARSRLKSARVSEASAFEIPYPDASFDLVFTSGVLIHIAPVDLSRAMAEIVRCSNSWIWGLEYFAAEPTEVQYRGHDKLLWKMDYARLYLEQCSDLQLVRAEKLPYLKDSNVDCMFLLKKKQREK
jgi:pseudaminic acid biosynthesis-associated methylase